VSGLIRDAATAPERRVGNDAVADREVIGSADGCAPFSLRVVRCVRGRSFERRTDADEELLFVLAGHGTLLADGRPHGLAPQTGARVAPWTRYELDNERLEDLVLVSVALRGPEPGGGDAITVSALADAATREATADRTFRIVHDPDNGCLTATQFVGEIPVGAAPTHYHLYEEVIYVLEGDGVMHMNDAHTPLHAGTCIHLPARKLHTLENSGPGVMRVLGAFRPAGSPAAAYYPDGTPAYTADEPAASLSK
jgi:mannose-6-phosphate isomerase-like protein (cupin superfamily)